MTLVHDREAERLLVGIILNYNDKFDEVADEIREEMFFIPIYGILFHYMSDMIRNGEPVTIVSLDAYCKQHPNDVQITIADIMELTDSYDFNALPRLCSYVKEMYKRREVQRLANNMLIESAHMSEIPIEETMEDLLDGVKELANDTRVSITSVRDALCALQTIAENNSTANKKRGAPSGFKYFDERGGLQKTDLIIIAARSSNGKTSMALDMALSAGEHGIPVAYYSFEMKADRLMARAIASKTGLSSGVITYRPMDQEEYRIFDKGVGILENYPIFFDDNTKPRLDRLISSIRTMVHKKNVEGVFVDYLQVLSAYRDKNESEEQFLGAAARKLKDLALELNIFVVVLSQLNRAKGDGETWQPKVDSIRGSGQINEAADISLLIYRPEVYKETQYADFPTADVHGTAEIIIAKGRHIGTGEFLLNFDAKRTHFSDLENGIPLAPAEPFPMPQETSIPIF